MSNKKRSQFNGGRPMSASQFMDLLNSPWNNLAKGIDQHVASVYYPNVQLDMPKIQFDVQKRLADQNKADPKGRSTQNASWDQFWNSGDSATAAVDPNLKVNQIVNNSVMGEFNGRPYTASQYQRMNEANRKSFGNLRANNEGLKREGVNQVTQGNSLGNRLFDILSRFEYAGANVQKENTLNKADLFDVGSTMLHTVANAVGSAITGGRTSEQLSYDAAMSRLQQMEVAVAPGGLEQGNYGLADLVDKYKMQLEMKYGTYHPAVHPVYGDYQRPTGEATPYTQTKDFARNVKRIGGEGVDWSPSIIPTSSKEIASWWEGFTGKAKTTYIENRIARGDKHPAIAGLIESVIFDPTTYFTGGGGAISKGVKGALKLGGIERSIGKFKDITELDNAFSSINKVLDGEKIVVRGKEFTFGANASQEEWRTLIGLGDKTGRQAGKGRMARSASALINDIGKQVDSKIAARYKGLTDEMNNLRKAIQKSNDPIVIQKATENLAAKAATMNLEKDLADTIETLVRQGDTFTEVPQPKVVLPKSGSDKAFATSLKDSMGRKMARMKYAQEAAKAHAAQVVKPLGKVATENAAKAKPTAVRVVVKGGDIRKAIPAVLKAKDPSFLKAMSDYTQYIAAHGNDGRSALTIEDVMTSPELMANPHIAPEIKNLLPYMNLEKVTTEDKIVKTLQAEGMTTSEAIRAVASYKQALAEDILGNGHNWYTDVPRLADQKLDWSVVGAARKSNAAVIKEAMDMVKESQKTVQTNIAQFIAAGAIKMQQAAGVKRALEIRFLGIPLIHLTTPEAINKAFNVFLKGDNMIAKFIGDFNEALMKKFRGYSALDAELNKARTQTINAGEQVIHTHLNVLNNTWAAITKSKQKSIFDEWVKGANPETLNKYGAQLAQVDEVFAALKSYMPGLVNKPIEQITSADVARMINPFIHKQYRLDTEIMDAVKADKSTEFLSPEFWRKYYKKAAINKGKEFDKSLGISAPELIWTHRVAQEKAIAYNNLLHTIEDNWGVLKPLSEDPVANAQWDLLAGKQAPPATRYITIDGHGFSKDVHFDPQIAHEIGKLMTLLKNHTADEIYITTGHRIMSGWKAAVTVFNIPEYAIRNGFSDSIMMFLAQVNPKYAKAGFETIADTGIHRHLLRTNPEYARAFTMADGAALNKEALAFAQNLSDKAAKESGTSKVIFFDRPLVGSDGEKINSLTSTDIMRLYYTNGLETNFVRTSLGAVAPRMGTLSKRIGEPIKDFNSFAEDSRRLTLFIDGLDRAQKAGIKNLDDAVEYSADRVRKYLFDYTDFSNFERNTLGSLIPFYKWTRKAIPLVTEMIFLKPGKVAMFPKVQTAINTAMGAPPDGETYPWMATPDVIVPSYMRMNPMLYLGDANAQDATYGIYGRIPNPVTDVMQTLEGLLPTGDANLDPTASLGQEATSEVGQAFNTIGGMMNPMLRLPVETGLRTQFFGANQTGGRPFKPDATILDQLSGMLPQVNKVQQITQGGASQFTDPVQLANFLGLMSVQPNSPTTQNSEMLFLNKLAKGAYDKAVKARMANGGK